MLTHRDRRVKDEEMAGFTATAVERFVRAGVPAENRMRRFGMGAASACGLLPLDRAHGSSSIASAASGVQARKRRSRSVHGLPSTPEGG